MEDMDLVECLAHRTRSRPHAQLYTSADGTQSMDLAAFEQRANQLAHALRSLQVGPGSRVAILTKHQSECALLVFAALKIGAMCVPINWRLATDEIRFILDDADVRVLVTDCEFASQAMAAAGQRDTTVFLTDGAVAGLQRRNAWAAGFDTHAPTHHITPDDAAILIYSSGTTGQPKGVVLTHRGLLSACHTTTQAWKLDHDSVLAHSLPTFHIAGMLLILFPIYAACRCVTIKEFNPKDYLLVLSGQKISHVLVVPAMIGFLLAQPCARELDFSHLKLMAYGASPITDSVLQAAMEVFNCDFSQIYGLTEVAGVATNLTPDDHRRGADLLRSAGRPMPNTELRVVDPLTLAALEDGRVGEVWIRCDRSFKEYWGNPPATQASFPEGRDTAGGWFRSGDAGYLQDGYLFLSDRIKDMIVSGGENIYPAEVENILMKHPAVADGAVIGVPDPTWGESVKACVVLRSGAAVSEAELIAFMRARMAHFKCPKTVDFMEALPRTDSGKLLKRTLRVPYWSGQQRAIG